MRELSVSWSSDRHLRVSVGSDISLDTHRRVRNVVAALRGASIPFVIDIVPAYTTVTVEFDVFGFNAADAERAVRSVAANAPDLGHGVGEVVELPVCYERECAPDLSSVAAEVGMSTEEVVSLHAGREYTVYFVGFMPGFAYLGEVDSRLSVPRLATPRVRVPPGSVAIAGAQTGVYPQASPGGWRIIGRTPLGMFDAHRKRPSRLEIGDRVRFVPITIAQYGSEVWRA